MNNIAAMFSFYINCFGNPLDNTTRRNYALDKKDFHLVSRTAVISVQYMAGGDCILRWHLSPTLLPKRLRESCRFLLEFDLKEFKFWNFTACNSTLSARLLDDMSTQLRCPLGLLSLLPTTLELPAVENTPTVLEWKARPFGNLCWLNAAMGFLLGCPPIRQRIFRSMQPVAIDAVTARRHLATGPNSSLIELLQTAVLDCYRSGGNLTKCMINLLYTEMQLLGLLGLDAAQLHARLNERVALLDVNGRIVKDNKGKPKDIVAFSANTGYHEIVKHMGDNKMYEPNIFLDLFQPLQMRKLDQQAFIDAKQQSSASIQTFVFTHIMFKFHAAVINALPDEVKKIKAVQAYIRNMGLSRNDIYSSVINTLHYDGRTVTQKLLLNKKEHWQLPEELIWGYSIFFKYLHDWWKTGVDAKQRQKILADEIASSIDDKANRSVEETALEVNRDYDTYVPPEKWSLGRILEDSVRERYAVDINVWRIVRDHPDKILFPPLNFTFKRRRGIRSHQEFAKVQLQLSATDHDLNFYVDPFGMRSWDVTDRNVLPDYFPVRFNWSITVKNLDLSSLQCQVGADTYIVTAMLLSYVKADNQGTSTTGVTAAGQGSVVHWYDVLLTSDAGYVEFNDLSQYVHLKLSKLELETIVKTHAIKWMCVAKLT